VTTAPAGPSRWLFDVWSTFYDLPIVQRLTYRPVQDAVVDLLRATRPRHVLDVGCGTGLLASRLRSELDGTSIVGCDFSYGMLAHARLHGERVAWVQGDAQQLPFRKASADAIVSTEAFHWFPDKRRALAEFFRVLVPGGRVIVALVNTPNEVARTVVRMGSRVVGQPFDWPTRAEMRELFESAGFRVETQRRVFRIPAGMLLPPVVTVGVRPG
jgi:ubiquinone/menaquinone biosynthesis C-methylase UbiE